MRILLLGGSGRSGANSARRLVASDLVSEVGIAGRNQDALDRVVAETGNKARAVQVDILDERRLASVAADYDIVVNTAGPECEVLLPALRGAIAAGKHYCDIGADGPTVDKQLELDSTARDRDIVAIPGMGVCPGLDNLLAVHAYQQLDRTEEIQLCFYVTGYFNKAVDDLRKRGRIDTSLQQIINAMSESARVYSDGSWTDIDALENRVRITLPEGGMVTAFPYSHSETITLPRYLNDLRNVSRVWGVPNPGLGELMFGFAGQISCGEMSAEVGTRQLLETIGKDPDRWLKIQSRPTASPAEAKPKRPWQGWWEAWIVATGWKEGRRGRYTCWPLKLGHPLTVAVLRILRGEVPVRGVLPPEACFEPLPFFDEMASLLPDPPADGKLIGESFEWLE